MTICTQLKKIRVSLAKNGVMEAVIIIIIFINSTVYVSTSKIAQFLLFPNMFCTSWIKFCAELVLKRFSIKFASFSDYPTNPLNQLGWIIGSLLYISKCKELHLLIFSHFDIYLCWRRMRRRLHIGLLFTGKEDESNISSVVPILKGR